MCGKAYNFDPDLRSVELNFFFLFQIFFLSNITCIFIIRAWGKNSPIYRYKNKLIKYGLFMEWLNTGKRELAAPVLTVSLGRVCLSDQAGFVSSGW